MGKWIDLEKSDFNKFGVGTVQYKHKLLESGLFDDDALASLIEKTPREYYLITTMSKMGEKKIWRNGDFNGLSGHAVLAAIKKGQLWLTLRNFDSFAPEYQKIIDASIDEINSQTRDKSMGRKQTQLLISSPNARVFYHTDVPLVNLWHLRGKKRFYLWDENNKTFLPDQSLEGVILRTTEEEIFYNPQWDKEANIIDLEPGMAVTWPQNGPHKVENMDGLNVSLSMEYLTPRAKRKYGVYFTNGILRRYLGMDPKDVSVDGIQALAKCALALAIKKSGITKTQEREIIKSFVLSREKIGRIVDLPQDKQTPILQA